MRSIRVDATSVVLGLLLGFTLALLMGVAGDSEVRYQIASPQSDYFYVIDVRTGDIFYKRGPGKEALRYEREGTRYTEEPGEFIEMPEDQGQ